MILVTGATGFVGQRLIRRLVQEQRYTVRVLLRPGGALDTLPRGAPIHVTMADITNPGALEQAMTGVHTVIHLVGTEMRGRHSQLQKVDVAGAKAVIEAAAAKRVGRLIYVSRLGADKGSAYPVLRTRGVIEEAVRNSGLAYTIFRTGVLFGEGDHFTDHVAMLARTFPVYFVPGDGEQILHPLWVEDLATCLVVGLENLDLIDRTVSLGGPEILSYRRIVMRVMYAIRHRRPIIGLPLLVHRVAAWYLDGVFERWPINPHWIELLSTAQSAELGIIERVFGFRPAACDIGLIDKYMHGRRYRGEFLRYISTRRW